MHVEFKTTRESDHIRVDMTGDRVGARQVKAEALQVWRAIADECRTTGMGKVLLVSAIKGKLDTFDAYNIVKQLPGLDWGRRPKIAFVGGEDGSLESARFAETVAAMSGLRARVFQNEAEAVEWLRQ